VTTTRAGQLGFCKKVQKVTPSSGRLEQEGGFYLGHLFQKEGSVAAFYAVSLHDIGLESYPRRDRLFLISDYMS
jgi:hypothetical protein